MQSSEVLLDVYGAYLDAQLKSEPATEDLSSVLAQAQDSLAKANERERLSRRAVQIALAAKDKADFLMDQLIARFHLAVLAAVGKDRSSVLYTRYFPKGLSPLQKSTWTREIERIKVIEADLTGAADAAPLKPWLETIASHREKLERTIAVWQDARIAHIDARGAEMSEREAWIATYRSIHADLVKLFPHSRKYVERFFRRVEPRKPRNDDNTKLIEKPSGEEAAA